MALKNLAKLFGDTPLYMVGGAVRNKLLGVKAKDIDITSSMRAEDVIKLLSNTDFKVMPSSLRMGTLIIKDGKQSYEYTSFRCDSYPPQSGVHTPSKVTFTDDIRLDAKRRDFTINAIYEDVLTGEFVDPLGGIDDVRSRVIKTTRTPYEVFSEDGLRLMRLARFYAQLGFEIDDEVLEAGRSLAYLLKDISVERIEDELSKILVADISGYGNIYGHYNGIKLLIEIGAMQYVIPELLEGDGVKQNPKFHKTDVLTHILNAFKYSDPQIRLVALLHDIGKPYELRDQGNMYNHAERGAIISRNILTRLRFPNSVIEQVTKLVSLHMFDIQGTAKESTVRKFIVENSKYIDKFLLMRWADQMGGNGDLTTYNKIKDIYLQMKEEKTPMCLRELAINGDDIKCLGFKGKDIGKVLERTLYAIAQKKTTNEKEKLLEYVRGEKWD